MVSECMRLLEDNEVRVRLAVGQLLRSLAAKHGVTVIKQCQERVLASVNDHFVSVPLSMMYVRCKRDRLGPATSSLTLWPLYTISSSPVSGALSMSASS